MEDVDDVDLDGLREDVRDQMKGVGLPNVAAMTAMAQRSEEYLRGLVTAVRRTEGLLNLVDRTLRVSQPPLAGKLGVRWWKLTGSDSLRMPVLVRWYPVRGGRWRSKVLRKLRTDLVNREGTAGLCADETYELGMLAVALIRRYGELRKALSSEERRLKACQRGAEAELERITAAAIFRHGMVVRKLLKAGYSVGADVGQLTGRYLAD